MFLLAVMIKHKQALRERVAGGHCGRPLNFEDTGPSCMKPAMKQWAVVLHWKIAHRAVATNGLMIHKSWVGLFRPRQRRLNTLSLIVAVRVAAHWSLWIEFEARASYTGSAKLQRDVVCTQVCV